MRDQDVTRNRALLPEVRSSSQAGSVPCQPARGPQRPGGRRGAARVYAPRSSALLTRADLAVWGPAASGQALGPRRALRGRAASCGCNHSRGRAAQTTTTETTLETTTAPRTTESTTVTVQQPTTRRVIVPTTTTTSPRAARAPHRPWVWVLLGAVALAAIGLLAAFLTRRGGQRGVPGEERRRRLDGAVASWIDRAGMGDRQSDGGLRRLAPRQRGAARRR